MSKYRKINKPGWWECQPGHGGRIHVLLIDNGWAFGWRSLTKGKVVATALNIEVNFCKHLPDCTGWDWQPGPGTQEIDFPDWILPGWNYVTRDNGNDAPELWCERPAPEAGIWNHTLRIPSDRTLDFVDASSVPPVPNDDWTRAIWILPGWNYVTRDNGNDAPELWCQRPAPDADICNHTLRISSDRTLDFVDTSWVPPVPMDGWERAIWKRKQKEK